MNEGSEAVQLFEKLVDAGRGRVLRYLGVDPSLTCVLGLAEREDGSMVLDLVEMIQCPVHGSHPKSQGLYVVPVEVLE